MPLYSSIKNVFKERLDLLFFGVFLWLVPFSWRKVLWFYPLQGSGVFNEYTDISLYISDIFLILAIAIYIIEHYKYIVSIYRKIVCSTWNIRTSILFPALIIILAFISIFWSEQKSLAFYSALKLAEMVALYYYVCINIVPRGTNKECSTWNILKYIFSILVISGLVQSFVAIMQFFHKASIGLSFLGESSLGIHIPAVAKIIFLNHIFVRAYGTMPHPNILGGFLLLSLVSLMYMKKEKMFHVEHWKYAFIGLILLSGIILTFSKSSFLGLLIVTFYICSTWNNINTDQTNIQLQRRHIIRIKNLFHVEHLIALLILMGLLLSIIGLQNQAYLKQSIQERFIVLPTVKHALINDTFFGLGMGQMVYNEPLIESLQSWQFQPIHNIYLLIWSEIGLIGLLLFLIFLWSILQNVPRGTNGYIWIFCIALLCIGFFDHYLWDIQTGQIVFWLSLGVVSGIQYLTNSKNNV